MRMDTEGMARAKAYFGRPAWDRILQEVWKKYAGLGRIGGQAAVKRLSESECDVINSFFGWNYRAGDTGLIPLALFNQELGDSGFAPMDIHRLHVLLNGKPLLTKLEERILLNDGWLGFIQTIRVMEQVSLCPVAEKWLSDLEKGTGAGGRTLRDLHHINMGLALPAARVVVRSLNELFPVEGHLRQESIRLPVLAARVSGNAHALDMTEPAGRMLAALLREQMNVLSLGNVPESAEDAGALEDGSESL